MQNKNIVASLHQKRSKQKHLAMKNKTFTIGQEVTFKGSYGVNVITEIKGNTAKTKELNTGFEYTKRLSSLTPYVKKSAYWSEQEAAHMNSPHKHGETVYSIIDISGTGGRKVWDDVKKECVNPEDLTQI